ncbi:MAG: hypothetical protein KAJ98_08365 [Spirochaetaceae bacterium]|nr:hypothetical protein [Spirochaetaceae bacterium]
MSIHIPIEQRVEMFQSFYRRENIRPLFGFFLDSEYPVTRYPSMENLPEDRPLTPNDFDVPAFLDDSEKLQQMHEECGGDFIWSASAYWGIPWLEAALGCSLFVNHSSGSIYSEPPSSFGTDSTEIQFDIQNPWITLMGKMLKGLEARSDGKWPIGTTRMRGISDLLSALYGGADWIIAMMEDPEPMNRLCSMLTDFWLETARYQTDRIHVFHGGIGSFYYYLWAPRHTVWCQEDATALLSPALYDRFIEPSLRRIVESLEGAIMHQHSTGFVPTDSYLTMGFHALELHIDEGGPSAEELFDRYKRILGSKPLIIWGDIPERDLDWIFTRLPHQGLAVITVVNNPDEAKSLWINTKVQGIG